MQYLSFKSLSKCKELISDDEGFVPRVYKDTKGFDTIGFGFNLEKIKMPLRVAKLWLEDIIEQIEDELNTNISFYLHLNDARKYVLINMAYQMGIGGLLLFRDMLKALADSNYPLAAKEMIDSKWGKEFSKRALRLQKIMLSGEF